MSKTTDESNEIVKDKIRDYFNTGYNRKIKIREDVDTGVEIDEKGEEIDPIDLSSSPRKIKVSKVENDWPKHIIMYCSKRVDGGATVTISNPINCTFEICGETCEVISGSDKKKCKLPPGSRFTPPPCKNCDFTGYNDKKCMIIKLDNNPIPSAFSLVIKVERVGELIEPCGLGEQGHEPDPVTVTIGQPPPK